MLLRPPRTASTTSLGTSHPLGPDESFWWEERVSRFPLLPAECHSPASGGHPPSDMAAGDGRRDRGGLRHPARPTWPEFL